jgi:hypothetical protein
VQTNLFFNLLLTLQKGHQLWQIYWAGGGTMFATDLIYQSLGAGTAIAAPGTQMPSTNYTIRRRVCFLIYQYYLRR